MVLGFCVPRVLDDVHHSKSYVEILKLSPSSLQGLEHSADEIFAKLRIESIEDLGAWKFYKIAKSIAVLATTEERGRRNPIGSSNFNAAVIQEWETKSFNEILDAPITALQGLADWVPGSLNQLPLAPRTVRQLAEWKYCQWAEAFINLAASNGIIESPKPDVVITTVTKEVRVEETFATPGPRPKIFKVTHAQSDTSVCIAKTSQQTNRRSSVDVAYPKLTPKTTPPTSVKKVSRFFNDLEENKDVSDDIRKHLGGQLHQLVLRNELEAMKVLLQQGADPDGGGSARSPLYTAVDIKNVGACEILLKYGASMVFSVQASGKISNPLKLALQDPSLATLFTKRLQQLENRKEKDLGDLLLKTSQDLLSSSVPDTPDF